jgi:hypothetical protein
MLASEELGKQLWEIAQLMIKDAEREAAIKRAKGKGKMKAQEDMKDMKDELEPDGQDEELIAKLKQRKEALRKILEEEEAKEHEERAKAKLPASMDAPNRNTRSRTEEIRAEVRKAAEAKAEVAVDTPSRNTRRRTKKI